MLFFGVFQDDEYVCRFCLQAELPSLEETFDLLSYARKRVSQVKNSILQDFKLIMIDEVPDYTFKSFYCS